MDILNVAGNIFLEQRDLWWLAFLFLFGWVWTVKVNNVDTYMAAYINDLQDCKVDTDEVPILQNILGGSDFGTWSQSDANKGRGWLTYDAGNDNGIAPPAVGDVATGVTSGTVAKVISYTTATGTWPGTNATGVITLGACSTGCFNDNETVNFTSGASCVVNHPVAVVGVDGIVKNGAFVPIADDPPTSWNAYSAAMLTTEAGGQVGNCMKVLENGGGNPGARQDSIPVTAGKIYKLSFYHKDIDATGDNPKWGILDETHMLWIIALTSETANAAWTQVVATFEVPSGCTAIRVYLQHSAGIGDADAYYFDEVTCYEITPCCTEADTLAWDGDEWTKESGLDLYREHWDGGTNTKEGSFYALKCVPDDVNNFVNWRYDIRSNAEHLAKFYDRTAIMGMWVKTSTANHFRICMYEGGLGTSVYSDYHTGGGAWEWLEVPITYITTGTYIYMQWRMYQPDNIDGSTIVYISQPMLIFCPAVDGIIGEGNYTPGYQEEILLKKKIPSNLLDGETGLDDVAVADLNIEADSDAMLPKGCKAVKILTQCNDSASAGGADCYLRFRADATKDYEYYNSPWGLVNDCDHRVLGWQQCGMYGDIDYNIDEAAGASGFDIDQMDYVAVRIN